MLHPCRETAPGMWELVPSLVCPDGEPGHSLARAISQWGALSSSSFCEEPVLRTMGIKLWLIEECGHQETSNDFPLSP